MSNKPIKIAEDFIRMSLDRARYACKAEQTAPLAESKDQRDARIISLVSHFQITVLMEQLRRVDPGLADSVARWLVETLVDGGTVHELIWQWNRDLELQHPFTGIGPKPAEPAPPAEAVPITDWLLGVAPLGMPSEVPGLQVVQATRQSPEGQMSILAGQWIVLHVPSKRSLHAHRVYPLDVAQHIVKELAGLLDWTRTGEEVNAQLADKENPAMVRARFNAVFESVEPCAWHSDADHLQQPHFRAG